MREIKFRGKRVDNGKWVYGDLSQSNKEIFIIHKYYSAGCTMKAVIPETVGQYTGLKDKNGVEIYEGDIIQIYSIFNNKKLYIGYIVYCDNASFNIYIGDILQPITNHIKFSNDYIYEVIGNMYDNKNLLEV